MGRLDGKVAVVTGASRGTGAGIARVLGQEGATVWVTGRTSNDEATVPEFPHSIEDTAEEVTAAGGRGKAFRCDHTDDEQVKALFEKVDLDEGRLDLLVCNAWGGYMPYEQHIDWFRTPFWEQSMERWDGMFTAGLRAHLSTCLFGIPLLMSSKPSLIVMTTFTQGRKYLGNVFYDVAKNGVCRAAETLAGELEDHGVAVVALAPGWVFVERMSELEGHELAQTESPEYTGRAVAALAVDPGVMRRTGQSWAVGDLAREYGFTDIDGRQPTAYTIVR